MKNTETQQKKAAQPYFEVRPLLLAAAVLSLIFLLTGGLQSYSGQKRRAERRRKRAALESYAARDAYVKPTPKPRVDGNGRLAVSDIEAEKQKILNGEGDSKADIQRRFRNAALIGDSFADDAVHYKFLDSTAVFAAIGARASADDPSVKKAIDMGKYVFIFTYGTNDMHVYGEKVDTMINRYTASINYIRQNVHGAQIYVQGIFPPREDKRANYPYIDIYNERLLKMCNELNVGFFDSSFIMEEHPEMYEGDGIHISRFIYGKWLTYLADVAGL